MQNGYIFSDTIANNICVYDKKDKKRLDQALAQVNLKQFVESLPHGYNTKIGNEGLQLSQGQRQRILLARVIYKNPRYIFWMKLPIPSIPKTNSRSCVTSNLLSAVIPQ